MRLSHRQCHPQPLPKLIKTITCIKQPWNLLLDLSEKKMGRVKNELGRLSERREEFKELLNHQFHKQMKGKTEQTNSDSSN